MREGNVSDILDKFQFLKTKRSISLRYSGFFHVFPVFFGGHVFIKVGSHTPSILNLGKTSNIWQCNKGPFDTPGLGSRVLGSADGGRNGHCEDTNLQLSIVVLLTAFEGIFSNYCTIYTPKFAHISKHLPGLLLLSMLVYDHL